MSSVDATRHVPVLLEEVVELLASTEALEPSAPMLDCTMGGGGHSEALLARFDKAPLVALDCDVSALERSSERLKAYQGRFLTIEGNFADLPALLERESSRLAAEFGLTKPYRFSRILADFGYSSDQLDDPERGLSFALDGPLDMRLDPAGELSASNVVNEYSEPKLASVFKKGGVGRLSRALAVEISRARPVKGTKELASICERVLIKDRKKDGAAVSKAPLATVPFQAIRIEVNQELRVIRDLLEQVPNLLLPGGRFAAICFHSLEDQLVARAMRSWERSDLPSGVPVIGKPKGDGELLTKSAVTASEEELKQNSRARSARLRVFEKRVGENVA